MPYTSEQFQAALETAYENMLAFNRYKQTPVVLVRDGRVAEVSPDALSPTGQAVA